MVAPDHPGVLFQLSPRFDASSATRFSSGRTPRVTDPTTGGPARDDFLFIANAQIRSFDEKGKIFPDDKVERVRILRVPLGRNALGAEATRAASQPPAARLSIPLSPPRRIPVSHAAEARLGGDRR